MLKAEHQQEQRVRDNAANCEQLKSELERIQQRQRELDMQKVARPKEPGPWRWMKLTDRRDGTQTIRPLMDVALPGYTPSSTPSGSQVSGSSSRLKELNERLQLRNRENPARVELPPTWREQPIRSVVISSYKKNTEGRYHRHNRMDWSTAQRVRRDCSHDAAWVEYHTQPREGTACCGCSPGFNRIGRLGS